MIESKGLLGRSLRRARPSCGCQPCSCWSGRHAPGRTTWPRRSTRICHWPSLTLTGNRAAGGSASARHALKTRRSSLVPDEAYRRHARKTAGTSDPSSPTVGARRVSDSELEVGELNGGAEERFEVDGADDGAAAPLSKIDGSDAALPARAAAREGSIASSARRQREEPGTIVANSDASEGSKGSIRSTHNCHTCTRRWASRKAPPPDGEATRASNNASVYDEGMVGSACTATVLHAATEGGSDGSLRPPYRHKRPVV